jgi:hypothetical protein
MSVQIFWTFRLTPKFSVVVQLEQYRKESMTVFIKQIVIPSFRP